MFFAKFKLYLFSQKRKLLRYFRPASWFATAKRGGCYWHPSPRSYLFLLLLFLRSRSFLASTSLSLVSTLIRWHVCKMARCVSGIHFHVCQKSNESWAKLFEQGRAGLLLSPTLLLLLPPTWFAAPFGAFVHIVGVVFRLKFMGNCLPTNKESGILCFLKFNVTVFADCV